MRFNELITGVREDIAVKLYGDDLTILAEKAEEIGKIVATVEGVADMKVEATSGQPQITINYNRAKLAQYGLQIIDLNKLIETAFAGGIAGTIFEGEKRFDLVVRLKKELRQDLSDVKNLFVSLPNGTQIPLKEVANISYKSGPMQISRDNTNRRTYVGINVRGRDIKSLVEEIQQKIEAQVTLPTGYYVRYGGAFENLERATSKLKIVVPIALGLIFVLIFMALKSFKQTIMIYMAIPLATIGGIFSLVLRDMPFSISAGVGFIVLFGVSALHGLDLISGFNELKEEGVTDVNERIRLGTRRRIRPILLTALTDMLGFLPMALSTSSGAEVQQPLATVVIGGLLTSTLLTLFIIPILYKWMENMEENKRAFLVPKHVFLLVFLLGFGILQAQNKTVSIEEAVTLAIKNHPSIEAANLSVAKGEALKGTAWDFGNTRFFTSAEEVGHNNIPDYTTFGIGQSNIDVFGIASKKKLSNAAIKVTESSFELTILKLKKEVKLNWVKSYVSKQLHESYSEIDSVYSGLKVALDLRFETELISKLEHSLTTNQGSLIQLKKEQAYNDYQIALLELNSWLLSDDLLDVSTTGLVGFDISEISLESELKTHPLQTYWNNQLAVATAEKKVAKSGFLPKLSGEYGFQKIGGESGFNSYQIGFQIPLFFINTRAKVKAAKINEQIITQENKVKTIQLHTNYMSLLNEYKQAQRNWDYYKNEALPLAIEQRNGAILSYKEGAMDYLDFLQNMKAAIELEVKTWRVLETYLSHKIQIEYFLNTSK
jgi:cobalt-zinc-cadmium resistance protein CzcA